MKKIIFLFLMFSGIVFAKWEVEYSYTKSGDDLIVFVTTSLGSTNFSSIRVGVNVKYDYSTVLIESINIDEDDNIALIITDNEGNEIYCNFYPDDIEDYCVNVPSNRTSVLTKMLYNGKSATLKINGEVSDTFDLKGIKQIMQKHVGNSYWYKYKLND